MSKESAQKFLAEMQKDESQFKKLASMDGGAVTKLAKDKGFSCSVDELKQVLAESRKGALSEKELAGVAGGSAGYKLNEGLVGRVFPDNLSSLWTGPASFGDAPHQGGSHTGGPGGATDRPQPGGATNRPGTNTPRR